MASTARQQAAAQAQMSELRACASPATSHLVALRDSLVGTASRKNNLAALLPPLLAEGLTTRGWSPSHVAAVLELIADVAPPPTLTPLASPLLAHLCNAPPSPPSSIVAPARALVVLIPRIELAAMPLCVPHVLPLLARMKQLQDERLSAAYVAHVLALLITRHTTAVDEAVFRDLVATLINLVDSASISSSLSAFSSSPSNVPHTNPSSATLATCMRALLCLLTSESAPALPAALLSPLWPHLSPLMRSPHPDLALLAGACMACAGPNDDRSRALLAVLRACSHPLRHVRLTAASLAAAAVRGKASSQTFAAIDAGALLRVETLLSQGSHEEHAAALVLLAELCSLSDEARAATHSLRLIPRLLSTAFPHTSSIFPANSSLSSVVPTPNVSLPVQVQAQAQAQAQVTQESLAALQCLRLLARGAPQVRSALVESGATTRALQALRTYSSTSVQHTRTVLGLLANLVVDIASAKRLFVENEGAATLALLVGADQPDMHARRTAMLVLRNAAHQANLATKIAILDALHFSDICALVCATDENLAEGALVLLRNLLHCDAAQVCIKMDLELLLQVASLPSHTQHSCARQLQALYLLCNIAATNEDLRAQVAAHEPSMVFLFAALASSHSAVRVAALWALYNLTWQHPERIAMVRDRGFAARLALLRADPVLDVRARASSITWL